MIATLQVPYADVRADDLRWSDAAVALPALGRVEVAIEGGGRLELVIVGCSHQVVVDAPWLQLTETVARLAGGRPLEPRSRHGAADGVRYRFDVGVERHDEDGFRASVERLLERLGGDDPRTVTGRFPGRAGAITALRCDRAEAGAVCWRTWHTYPGTGEIVTTCSEARRT